MAQMGDVTVRLRAKDEVSPVLRRLMWHVWLFRHGDAIAFALATLLTFVLGVLFGHFI